MEKKLDNPIIVKNQDGLFQLLDDKNHTLETKAAQRGLSIFTPYFKDSEQHIFKSDLTYVQLLELIKKLNRRLSRKDLPEVQTSDKFNEFVEQRQYYIKEQSQAGLTIKADDSRWNNEFQNFKKVVNQEVVRPLKVAREGFLLFDSYEESSKFFCTRCWENSNDVWRFCLFIKP